MSGLDEGRYLPGDTLGNLSTPEERQRGNKEAKEERGDKKGVSNKKKSCKNRREKIQVEDMRNGWTKTDEVRETKRGGRNKCMN